MSTKPIEPVPPKPTEAAPPYESKAHQPRTDREQQANPLLLSESAFCRTYGFARGTIRNFRRQGMPAIVIGSIVRIEPARALEWMRTQSADLNEEKSS